MLRYIANMRNKEVLFLIFILALLIGISSILSDRFLTSINIEHLLIQSVGVGIVSFALCAVILTSGIDLSIGMNVTLGECIASHLFVKSTPFGMAVVLTTCVIVGFFNSLGINRLRLNPFIMTFCMLLILQGLALFLRPVPGGMIPTEFYYLVMGNVYVIPRPFLILIGCFLLTWLILTKTKISRIRRWVDRA